MKRSFRRLQLSRETLGRLESGDLRKVLGGSGPTSSECIIPSCICDTDGCIQPTWEHTCTILCCSSMAHC